MSENQNPQDLTETGPTNPEATNFETAPTAPPQEGDFTQFEQIDDGAPLGGHPINLSKHMTVMDFSSNAAGSAIYEQTDTQDKPSEAISLNSEIYDAFGRPDKITVTVRPGDTLNR